MLTKGDRSDSLSVLYASYQQWLTIHDHIAAETFAKRQALVGDAPVEVH